MLPSSSVISKAIVALSNTAGGKLLIGIEYQTKRIVGVDDNDVIKIPDMISDMISDTISPNIIPEIYIERIENKNVVVVQVFPGSLKPYFIKSKGKINGTYIRVGASNRKVDLEMLQELERQRINLGLDEVAQHDKQLSDLDLVRLNIDFKALSKQDRDLNEEELLNLKICTQQGDTVRPTFGGLLLAAIRTPDHAMIQCARFKGNDIGEYIDQKEFTGPIYQQVKDAIAFAQTHISKSGVIENIQRKDRYLFPIPAIREALINAVVHRDYSISGGTIKFAIFDDRIEVTSPGALPKGMNIDDLMTGRSEIRNKVIARFFKEIHYIEQWGTGIERMIQYCREYGLQSPKFRESGLFFKVTFSVKLNHDLDWKKQLLILLSVNPAVSASQCAKVLNKSSRTIERQLAQYREEKVISRQGRTRGKWIVHK